MRSGNYFSKRGVSTVVATVLMILIVVALAGLVFVWARGFILKAENQALADKACEGVNFIQGQFCYNETMDGDETETYIQFDIRNDASNSKIEGFLILADYGGEIKSIPTLRFSEVESLSLKTVMSPPIDDFFDIKQISVAPQVSVKSKVFVCEKNTRIVYLEEIEQC
jgi:flagellin-like protein